MWRWLKDISNLLLPIHCLQCKCAIKKQSELFCLNCYSLLLKTEHFKNKENECYMRFLNDGFNLNYIAALFYFDDNSPIKSLIHLLKYKGKTDIGYYLGQLLGRKMNNVNDLLDADYIIPMPLHVKKRRERGYNQSDFIANGIHKITCCPILTNVVQRIKNTKTQTRMNKEERGENMKSAFKWVKSFPKHTHFVLVDDVVTTGASVQALILACENWKNYKFSVICIGYTR